jgi:hypothetical protein
VAEGGAAEAPAEAAKPARRRSRSRRAKPAPVEITAAEPVVLSEPAPGAAPSVSETPMAEPLQAAEAIVADSEAPDLFGRSSEPGEPEAVVESAEQPNILEAPAVGVEIVSTEERQGVVYFTIRDLRNCNTVHNVTPVSARKLWSYAINQYLKRPIDPEKVTWYGDYGLWQVGRRAKKLRYDLVKRQPDGSLRVFYGVTADGMDEPWAQFLKDKDRMV